LQPPSTALFSTLTLDGIVLLSFFTITVHKVEKHREHLNAISATNRLVQKGVGGAGRSGRK
tara:strand:+ start:316 stop:498 length:183 start_codon:yes stop_codon:yes gene_type:complete